MLKTISKFLFAALFIFAGTMHFIKPDFFLKIMPPYLPWHLAIVYISGVIEILLGVMLITSKYQNIAAWGLVALLIAVSPANIHMAMNPELFSEYTTKALYLRLVVQVILIIWAYWYVEKKS